MSKISFKFPRGQWVKGKWKRKIILALPSGPGVRYVESIAMVPVMQVVNIDIWFSRFWTRCSSVSSEELILATRVATRATISSCCAIMVGFGSVGLLLNAAEFQLLSGNPGGGSDDTENAAFRLGGKKRIPNEISLKYVASGLMDLKSSWVQVMTCWWIGDKSLWNKYTEPNLISWINSSDAGDRIFRLLGSIPCLQMHWLLKSPVYQRAWYWLCKTGNIFCCSRVNFNSLGQAKSKKQFKMWIYILWSLWIYLLYIFYDQCDHSSMLELKLRFNFNSSMDEWSHQLLSVGWNYLSIPKLQWCSCWLSLEWMNNFIPHFTGQVITYPW